MKDIFIEMQIKIGCLYVSNLPNYKCAVWNEMKHLCLSDYSEKQLHDFSNYVFGIPYNILKVELQRKDYDP